MTNLDHALPEFSLEIDLENLGRGKKNFQLQPTDAQRKKIANRLGALAVEDLDADVSLEVSKKEIRINGKARARLLRECVSSLEDMVERIDEDFEIIFLREQPDAIEPEDGDAFDSLEIHEGETIDLGELLVQQISLSMDPFPRKEGAASLAERYGREEADSPFQSLRQYFEKNKYNQ